MADNVTVDNGTLTDYIVSSDEATSGQIQRVKLAYSADGIDTHVAADGDGLLVNLGTNNDVVVSDGGGSITVDGAITANVGTPSSSSSATVTDDTTVTTTAESVASNANRRGLIVQAASANTASCFLRFGGTASATSWTVEVTPGAYWEMPTNVFTGAVSYVSASGTQTLHVTEW